MMSNQHRRFQFIRGFSLIELMVVVAIVGFLAAIALPSYTDYIRKSQRADGIAAILSLQLAQEKFRANCVEYAKKFDNNDDNCLPGTLSGSTIYHPNKSSDGHYDLSIQSSTNTSFAIRATPVSEDDQENDSCGYFELKINLPDPDGKVQPIQKLTETGNADRCWAHC